MHVPSSVSSCLYLGISKRIDYLKMVYTSESLTWDKHSENLIKEVKEAIEWYTEHCVLSSTYLHEAYQELEGLLNTKGE